MTRGEFTTLVIKNLRLKSYGDKRAEQIAEQAWDEADMEHEDQSFIRQFANKFSREMFAAEKRGDILAEIHRVRHELHSPAESDSKRSNAQCALCDDKGMIVAPHVVSERALCLESACPSCCAHIYGQHVDYVRNLHRQIQQAVNKDRGEVTDTRTGEVRDECDFEVYRRVLPRVVLHVGKNMPDNAKIYGMVLGFSAQTMGDLR